MIKVILYPKSEIENRNITKNVFKLPVAKINETVIYSTPLPSVLAEADVKNRLKAQATNKYKSIFPGLDWPSISSGLTVRRQIIILTFKFYLLHFLGKLLCH